MVLLFYVWGKGVGALWRGNKKRANDLKGKFFCKVNRPNTTPSFLFSCHNLNENNKKKKKLFFFSDRVSTSNLQYSFKDDTNPL